MKRGFGTNFHSVYLNNAEVYDIFSRAEIFSKKLIAEIKKSTRGDILLDLACGTGHKTNIFSKFFKKVYALDKSKELLSFAEKKYSKNKKVSYLLSSADKIPLLDNSVDSVIVTWGSFPLTKTIKEINRVLKPGGVALRIGVYGIDELTSLFPKFDIKRINRIKKVFEKSGYKPQKDIIKINFNNIKEAKNVLSIVLNIDKNKIIKKDFLHEIIIYKYVKSII